MKEKTNKNRKKERASQQLAIPNHIIHLMRYYFPIFRLLNHQELALKIIIFDNQNKEHHKGNKLHDTNDDIAARIGDIELKIIH